MSFFAQLSPGERLGELLFGLIMTLTFTIGAGVVIGTNEGASTELLYATIGCNVAWGIIDGALLVLGRLFERGRLSRIGHAVAQVSDEQRALAIVAAELDETLEPITAEADRQALYRAVVAAVKSTPRRMPRITAGDLVAAGAVCCLVFAASVPAALQRRSPACHHNHRDPDRRPVGRGGAGRRPNCAAGGDRDVDAARRRHPDCPGRAAARLRCQLRL
jgi:hypothetical protein